MKNEDKRSKFRRLILALLFVALGTVPLWGNEYLLLFCLLFCLYATMSQMWNLLIGYSGLLSLGQQAFIGFSGYTVAVLSSYYGVNVWAGVLIGGALCVLLALFMSLFIFRMKGLYFAIGTWIFAEILLLWFSNWKFVKYGTGLFIRPPSPPTMTGIYYAAFITGASSLALVYIILRSKIGLGLMAMRDNEKVAEAMGVKIFHLKLFCFLVAAFVTGVTAGVLYAFQIFIQPYKAFAIDWTIILTFVVIIGGIGTIEGPIIGSLIYVLLSQYLAEYAHVSLLILGSIAIAVIILAPKGIMGSLRDRTGFELLSVRRT